MSGAEMDDAVEQYREFLKIILRTGGRCGFANLSIDLVWHTDQMLGDRYRIHSLDLVGLFVDHLTQAESALTMAKYASVQRNWASAYGFQGYGDGERAPGGAGSCGNAYIAEAGSCTNAYIAGAGSCTNAHIEHGQGAFAGAGSCTNAAFAGAGSCTNAYIDHDQDSGGV